MKITFPKINIMILNILTMIIAALLMYLAIKKSYYGLGIISLLIASINFN